MPGASSAVGPRRTRNFTQQLVCLWASELAAAYSSHSSIDVTPGRLRSWWTTPKLGASWWLDLVTADRYSRASKALSLRPSATAEPTLATLASDTYLPSAPLEILRTRPNPLQLNPACGCRRNASRIRRMVTPFVGIDWDHKKRPAFAGQEFTCAPPPVVHDDAETASMIRLKRRPRSR